jgi:hypothetical protein
MRRLALIGIAVVLAGAGGSRIPLHASAVSPAAAAVARPAAQGPLCAPGQQCVAVDSDVAIGPATRKVAGFLHGIGPSTSPARILALRPTSWRASGGRGQHTQISLYAGITTEVLSDYWVGFTYNAQRGGGKPPWEDWNAYSTFVTNFVLAAKQQHWAPTYWEIQNEPDSWLGFPPGVKPTAAQALQVFRVGYDAVKRADPSAQVIGPSLSGFLARPIPSRPELVDMTTFLDFAVREHMHFDAIAWHETEPDYIPAGERRPESIPGHVAELRQMVAARPSLGRPLVFVNEYMYSANIDVPGWRVGYMAALEQSNVDLASMSCPLTTATDKGCYEPNLDRLLDSDGSTPRPGYWVVQSYAGMSGTHVATWTSDMHLSAFATKASQFGPVHVLLGRHQSCTPAVNPQCREPLSATPAPVDLTVAVRVGGLDRQAVVSVVRIADVNATMPAPEAPHFINVPVRGGVARVPVARFADGDAYALTVS